MVVAAPPRTSLTTAAELLRQLADYTPERLLLKPVPGTATVQDVGEIERLEGRLCELINGVLVEKTVRLKESVIAQRFGTAVRVYADAHDLGEVAGADGTIEILPDQVRIPDVAFFSWAKLPGKKLPDEPVPELVPDLAVEVLSAKNTLSEMARKRREYFLCGVKLVWIVDPMLRVVDVYTDPVQFTRLDETQTLDGGLVLPGFSFPVARMFV